MHICRLPGQYLPTQERNVRFQIQNLGLDFIKLLKPSTYKKVNPSDYPERNYWNLLIKMGVNQDHQMMILYTRV